VCVQPGFDALFASSSELRRETEDLARLQQQTAEQQQQLTLAQSAYREATRRLADVKVRTRECLCCDAAVPSSCGGCLALSEPGS
jgi:hypothetical protein